MSKKITFLLIILSGLFISTSAAGQSFDPSSLPIKWKFIKNPDKNDPLFRCQLTFTTKGKDILPKSGWKIYFNLRYHSYNLKSLNDQFEIKHVSGELFYIKPTAVFKGFDKNKPANMEYTGTQKIENYMDVAIGLFLVYDSRPSVAIALNKLSIKRPDSLGTNPKSSESDLAAVFNANSKIRNIPQGELPKIFPTPADFHELMGSFILNENTSIKSDENFKNEANYLADEIKKLTGKQPLLNGSEKTSNLIILKKGDSTPEAYRLEVKPGTISITAHDGAGVFYGIQSLKSLLPANAWAAIHTSLKIPSVTVADKPQFAFREFMLDVSRNFQPKNEILRVLDLMALYKMNIFHFHLTDDEGWRLAIPGIPELTDIGAKRGYPFNDGSQLHPSYGSGPDSKHSAGTGYYSKDDFVEILRYATRRHIRVIPEIESPGHARAAVVAMTARYNKYMRAGNKAEAEKYMLADLQDKSTYLSNQGFNDDVMNVALPSTYTFMEKVIDEVAAMYKEADAPLTLLHVGGDEVPEGSWGKSPVVIELLHKDPSIKNTKDIWTTYFQKIEKMLKSQGISMTGWEELAKGTQTADNSAKIIVNPDFIRDGVQLDAWWSIAGGQDAGYELANAGYKVVLCPFDYFYFDLPINRSFYEPGDSWIGYLDLKKVFSFAPYNYYTSTKDNMEGKPLPPNCFKAKELLTKAGKSNIIGMQAAMWEENINTSRLMEYMLLPRLLAVAERAWAKEPDWMTERDSSKAKKSFERGWSVFENVLAKNELPKLDFYNGGYNYRIPTAGMLISDGKVFANCDLPGFIIRYTTDGSVPTTKSARYVGAFSAKGNIKFSVFNMRGRSGRVVDVNNK
ncbi:MAG TPA: family 20 glycosylhydrolase [Mucilaginibacter sp.]|jgi:hexosaminidase